MNFKYRFVSAIRCKINRILKLDHFVNYCFSKNNFLNDSIAYVNERSTIKANISRTVRDTQMTRCRFEDTNVFLIRSSLLGILWHASSNPLYLPWHLVVLPNCIRYNLSAGQCMFSLVDPVISSHVRDSREVHLRSVLLCYASSVQQISSFVVVWSCWFLGCFHIALCLLGDLSMICLVQHAAFLYRLHRSSFHIFWI